MTSLLDPQRLARLRQKQETSFTPIFLHRPLAILFLIPTADIAWITPNGITYVSIVMRFITAALLWPESFGGVHETPTTLFVALGLWHLGSVLDAMDGALARYRGLSSGYGRYIDKVPDRIIALVTIMALAARAYVQTDGVIYVFCAMVYVSLTGVTSVAKWVHIGIEADMKRGATAADPIEKPAPKRTPLQWVLYGLWSLRTIVVVTEMDLPLWGTVAVLMHRETWLLTYLALFITPYTVGVLTIRGAAIWRMDRDRAKLQA